MRAASFLAALSLWALAVIVWLALHHQEAV